MHDGKALEYDSVPALLRRRDGAFRAMVQGAGIAHEALGAVDEGGAPQGAGRLSGAAGPSARRGSGPWPCCRSLPSTSSSHAGMATLGWPAGLRPGAGRRGRWSAARPMMWIQRSP